LVSLLPVFAETVSWLVKRESERERQTDTHLCRSGDNSFGFITTGFLQHIPFFIGLKTEKREREKIEKAAYNSNKMDF